MRTAAMILVLTIVLPACGGGSGGSGRGGNGGTSNALVITEVGLNPSSGGTWVEFLNTGTKPARISGVNVTSRAGDSVFDAVVLPAATADLAPGGYQVVALDLPTAGGVEIATRPEKPISAVNWPALDAARIPALAGTSYGITSNATWRVLTTPTPGAPNVDPDSPVLLNEICADNDEDFENPDAPGEYDDWIELHNPGAADAVLAGMSLTDDPAAPERWTFPAGTIIPAGGFLLVHADERMLSGLHASFRLPAESGTVCLFAADGSIVDAFAWDQMGEDRSRGRDGDGRPAWVAWRELTPGASNADGLRDRTDDSAHRKRSPDYDRVFDATQVKELRIEIAPGAFAKMEQNRDREITENPGDPDFRYVECTVRFEGDVWEHVGIRFKGASSSLYPWQQGFSKYPLKLDFDEFEDDWPEWKNQRFFGLKKLSLSNGVADPTYLREILCLQLMQEAGVTCSRVAPLAVYLDTGNGPRYWGLYMNVEQVDDEFLKDRYGDDGGNLYKPEGAGASLRKFVENHFEKKTNEDEADFTDVIDLIEVLGKAYPDLASQKAAIDAVFDVDSFLPWLAVTAVLVNFDSYLALNHNYYLYRHHDDDRFRFITWDHNQAFASPADVHRANDAPAWDILDPAYGDRPLINRILEVPEWREAYLDHVNSFRRGPFSEAAFGKRVADLHARLKPRVIGASGELAPFTVLTSPDFFERGLTEKLTPVGLVGIPGLLPLAAERREYLSLVLD